MQIVKYFTNNLGKEIDRLREPDDKMIISFRFKDGCYWSFELNHNASKDQLVEALLGVADLIREDQRNDQKNRA